MSYDPYAFWRAQLAGENPETTPGTPHAGYYTSGSAGTAYKRERPVDFIAIWQDDDGEWVARTDQANGEVRITTGWAVDEFVFSRCCRNAIEYEDYLAGVSSHELN